jgi:3-methyladenine DNA glycosylase Mpg
MEARRVVVAPESCWRFMAQAGRTPSNETLFGEPERFYVYVSYGI